MPNDCCTHCAHDEPRPHEAPCDDCAALRAEGAAAERQRIRDGSVLYSSDGQPMFYRVPVDLLDGAS